MSPLRPSCNKRKFNFLYFSSLIILFNSRDEYYCSQSLWMWAVVCLYVLKRNHSVSIFSIASSLKNFIFPKKKSSNVESYWKGTKKASTSNNRIYKNRGCSLLSGRHPLIIIDKWMMFIQCIISQHGSLRYRRRFVQYRPCCLQTYVPLQCRTCCSRFQLR